MAFLDFRSFPPLGAVALILFGMPGEPVAQMTRVPSSAARPDRADAEARFRRIDGDVKMTLRSCALARGLNQKCACHRQLERRRAEIDQAKVDTSNILETLMFVFKESVRKQNEEKQYYLKKLKQYNGMSEKIRGNVPTGAVRNCDALVPGRNRGNRAGEKKSRHRPHGLKSPEAAQSPMEQNIDRPGADYRSFAIPGNDPARCRNACAGDVRCKAWTFGRPGVRGAMGQCWLKSRIPPPRRNRCCVSGVK